MSSYGYLTTSGDSSDSFNTGIPRDRPPNTNPYHYQNRIIIIGDTNIDTHACGEHYILTRLLRACHRPSTRP